MAEQTTVRPAGSVQPRGRSWLRNRKLSLLGFIAPALTVIAVTNIYPFFYTLWTSFRNWNLAYSDASNTFIGIANYHDIIRDPEFWHAVRLSGVYTVSAVGLEFVFGFAIALLFHREFVGRGLFRSILLLPLAISPVVVGLMWRWLYNADAGFINYLFGLAHLPPQAWLVNPRVALPALIVIDIWEWTPFIMMIMLAGLQGLPDEVLEAGKIDGATGWQTLRFLTWPLLRSLAVVAIIFRTADAFRLIDTIFATTYGGPGAATKVLPLMTYFEAFKFFRLGYGAALAMIMIVVSTVWATVMVRRIEI